MKSVAKGGIAGFLVGLACMSAMIYFSCDDFSVYGGYCITKTIGLSALAFVIPATALGMIVGWAREKQAKSLPGFVASDWLYRGLVLFGIGWLLFSTSYTLYLSFIIKSTELHQLIGYLTIGLSAIYLLLSGISILISLVLSVGRKK